MEYNVAKITTKLGKVYFTVRTDDRTKEQCVQSCKSAVTAGKASPAHIAILSEGIATIDNIKTGVTEAFGLQIKKAGILYHEVQGITVLNVTK